MSVRCWGQEIDRIPSLGGWIGGARNLAALAKIALDRYLADPVRWVIAAHQRLGVDGMVPPVVPTSAEQIRTGLVLDCPNPQLLGIGRAFHVVPVLPSAGVFHSRTRRDTATFRPSSIPELEPLFVCQKPVLARVLPLAAMAGAKSQTNTFFFTSPCDFTSQKHCFDG